MRTTREHAALIALPVLTAALLPILGCAGLPSATAPMAADRRDEAAAAPAPATYDNTIRWATASEVDNFGFDVYRSESEDGPFDKLNDRVIEGAGTIDEPQRYEFVDDTIDPRKTYYYYVESISMSGVRQRFTPVGKAPPKIPPAEEQAPPSADG